MILLTIFKLLNIVTVAAAIERRPKGEISQLATESVARR